MVAFAVSSATQLRLHKILVVFPSLHTPHQASRHQRGAASGGQLKQLISRIAAGVLHMHQLGIGGGQSRDPLEFFINCADAAVDAFFDGVMVMVEEAPLRANRLALLSRLAGLMNRVADISKLSA
jgi:hypothetical protein